MEKHCAFFPIKSNLKRESHQWHRGVVVITTTQLHSTKPELGFCAGSNPARGVSEIHDGEDLWQWSRLEIRLNAFRRSTIPQKQFIIIIENENIISSNKKVAETFHEFFSNFVNCLNISQNPHLISGTSQTDPVLHSIEKFSKTP